MTLVTALLAFAGASRGQWQELKPVHVPPPRTVASPSPSDPPAVAAGCCGCACLLLPADRAYVRMPARRRRAGRLRANQDRNADVWGRWGNWDDGRSVALARRRLARCFSRWIPNAASPLPERELPTSHFTVRARHAAFQSLTRCCGARLYSHGVGHGCVRGRNRAIRRLWHRNSQLKRHMDLDTRGRLDRAHFGNLSPRPQIP